MKSILRQAKRRSLLLMAGGYYVPALIAIAMCGCSLTGGPRARLGYLPTSSAPFPSPDRLGTHGYAFNFSETSIFKS